MLRAYAWLMPLRLKVVNTCNKWNTHLLLPYKTFVPLKKSTSKKGTEHGKHPGTHTSQRKCSSYLSLSDKLGEASTCTQVTSHEQRPYSPWISERRLCSQHLLLCYYTSLLWTGHSHVNQARDEWDENDDRRGYQRCREQRQKHLDRRPLRTHLPSRKRPPEPHPLAPWPSPRAGKSSSSGFYGSIAAPSPPRTVHACSQATTAEPSAWREHWVPPGPKCLPSDPLQSLLTSALEPRLSD